MSVTIRICMGAATTAYHFLPLADKVFNKVSSLASFLLGIAKPAI